MLLNIRCPWVFYIDHWSASLRLHVSCVMQSGSAAQKDFQGYAASKLRNTHAYITSIHAWIYNTVYALCTNVGCKWCRTLSCWYFCPKPMDTHLLRHAVPLAVLSFWNLSHECKISYPSYSSNGCWEYMSMLAHCHVWVRLGHSWILGIIVCICTLGTFRFIFTFGATFSPTKNLKRGATKPRLLVSQSAARSSWVCVLHHCRSLSLNSSEEHLKPFSCLQPGRATLDSQTPIQLIMEFSKFYNFVSP